MCILQSLHPGRGVGAVCSLNNHTETPRLVFRCPAGRGMEKLRTSPTGSAMGKQIYSNSNRDRDRRPCPSRSSTSRLQRLRIQPETCRDLKTCHVPLSPDLIRSKCRRQPPGGRFLSLRSNFKLKMSSAPFLAQDGDSSCRCHWLKLLYFMVFT